MTIINHPILFNIELSEVLRTRRNKKRIYLRRFRNNKHREVISSTLHFLLSCPTQEYWVVTVCLLCTVICLKCHTANTLFSLMMPQRSARFENNWVGFWCFDGRERGTNKSSSQKTAWGNTFLTSIHPSVLSLLDVSDGRSRWNVTCVKGSCHTFQPALV